MPQTGRTFRIFVCSTFDDLKAERNALQKHVFSRLQQLCAGYGSRFQAIDLRWGVNEEASLDQRTMKICLEEIRRCQKVTPRPNFVVLLGDRYGWRPLPEEISADEFENLKMRIADHKDQQLLAQWYHRDDNAVPPAYILQPRTGEFEKSETWQPVEDDLHEILSRAAGQAFSEPDQFFKYAASATDHEIHGGAFADDLEAREHAHCFFRKINGLPEDGSAGVYIDVDEKGQPDTAAHDRLQGLKNKLSKNYPANVQQYEVDWKDISGTDPDDEATFSPAFRSYLASLCDDVYTALKKVILSELEKFEALDPLDLEIAEQQDFADDRSRFFTGRREYIERIGGYIDGSGGAGRQPLAVYGAGGIGKSALMAYAYRQSQKEKPEAVHVFRSIGATTESWDGRSLLDSICRHITKEYGGDMATIPSAYEDLVNELPKRLELAREDRPLVIFIDALDQLSRNYNARSLNWLPRELPPGVRLVLSGREDECLEQLKRLSEENLVELKPLPATEAEQLLGLWLDDAGRSLTSEQWREVFEKFAGSVSSAAPEGSPLFLKLAFEEARLWRSYSPPIELGEGVRGLIEDLFERLEREHGRMLVSHSLGYLAATRQMIGLAEDELIEILYRDEDVKGEFLAGIGGRKHRPPEERLPVVVWSRLYFDLDPYLVEKKSEGTPLLTFFHKELRIVAEEMFLGAGDGSGADIDMAASASEEKDVSGDLEGTGREDSARGSALDGVLEAAPADSGKVFPAHRELAKYFRLKASPDGEKAWTGTARALSELPFHLCRSENPGHWDELFELLTDFTFLENKAERVAVYEYKNPDGGSTSVFNGVFALMRDYEDCLRVFPGE